MTIYEFIQQQKKVLSRIISYIKSYNKGAITAPEDYQYTIKHSLFSDVAIYEGCGYNCTGDTPMWHLREYYRLQDGTYAPIPEAALSLLTNEQRKALSDVFAHCSKTPGLLAYTSTPEKGLRDIQTPIKPGRLLKKLFPNISDEIIREFESHFIVVSDARLEITRSFAEIYTERNLPCMSNYFYESDCHPTDDYNHSDNNTTSCD